MTRPGPGRVMTASDLRRARCCRGLGVTRERRLTERFPLLRTPALGSLMRPAFSAFLVFPPVTPGRQRRASFSSARSCRAATAAFK